MGPGKVEPTSNVGPVICKYQDIFSAKQYIVYEDNSIELSRQLKHGPDGCISELGEMIYPVPLSTLYASIVNDTVLNVSRMQSGCKHSQRILCVVFF